MNRYCEHCGKELVNEAVICPNCGCSVAKNNQKEYSKTVAILLWIFLGGIGGHRFYVNDNSGAITLILCLTVGWILIIPPFIGAMMLIADIISICRGEFRGKQLK